MKKIKCIITLLLIVSLLVPSVSTVPANAEVVNVTDPDLREYYVKELNTVVNAIKTDRPGMTVLAQGEIKENEDDADNKMADFAAIIVANVFENKKSLTADLIEQMNGNSVSAWQSTELEYERGAVDVSKIPVAGKDYVCNLSTKYNFTMRTLRNEDNKTTEILIEFPECTLLEALNTSKSDMSKVFDLPTNTDILLDDKDAEDTVVLEGGVFQLDDIVCTDAYIDITYNDNLQLVKYISNINYHVSVNTYTVLESIWPTFFGYLDSWGLEVGKLADFNLIEGIMFIINLFTDFDPEESMSSTYVDYTVNCKMDELDWTPHYFGDVNYDNRIDASDARSILRAAVSLESFRNAGVIFFADMDFDNVITSADARLALRVSVGLEKPFTSYAMRQEQLNATTPVVPPVVTPEVPTEPEAPTEPDVPIIPLD